MFGTKGETGMKWHPITIRLELLIHSKGQATYNALRDTGVLKLPGESTLWHYTNYIHPKTGFQVEAVDEIQDAAETLSESQRYVVLLHEEMKKDEKYTYCIPRYKEWEEKYAGIIKPLPKVEDYTHCIPLSLIHISEPTRLA